MDLKKILNEFETALKRIPSKFKNEEVKVVDEFSLWSQRMIESLIKDIDMIKQRIYKLECDTRNKK